MKIIILILLLFYFSACQQVLQCDYGNKKLLCSQLYDPVCAISYRPRGRQHKETFPNHCVACTSSNAAFTVQGKCEDYPKKAQFCNPFIKMLCVNVYNPVCGWWNNSIQCFAYPCADNANNSCTACLNNNVLYTTRGKCPPPGGFNNT